MALRMRQSLAELERAFVEEAWEERDRREALRREAAVRSRRRRIARQHKRGSWRFAVLVLMLTWHPGATGPMPFAGPAVLIAATLQ